MDNTGRADVRLRLHITKIKINHSSLILLNRLVKGIKKHGRNWSVILESYKEDFNVSHIRMFNFTMKSEKDCFSHVDFQWICPKNSKEYRKNITPRRHYFHQHHKFCTITSYSS
jgi:hypothetical protein